MKNTPGESADVLHGDGLMPDNVNHPPHYNRGPVEVIEIIESAIQDAPDMPTAFCHGSAIKYLLRLWLKGDPLENAKKCRWYLDRLIAKLGA